MSSSRHCDRTLSSAGGAGGGGLPGRGGKALAIRLGSKRRRSSSACKTKHTVSMSHEERHDGTWKAGAALGLLGMEALSPDQPSVWYDYPPLSIPGGFKLQNIAAG